MPCLASFTNSRLKPRNATSVAQTFKVTIDNVVETTIRPANANRTYLTLRNDDAVNTILYGYPANFGNLLTQGFVLKFGDAVDIESLQEVKAIALVAPVIASIDEGSG